MTRSWSVFFGPANLSDLLSDIKAGRAELTAALLQKQGPNATVVSLQKPELDAILLMQKLLAIYLTELI